MYNYTVADKSAIEKFLDTVRGSAMAQKVDSTHSANAYRRVSSSICTIFSLLATFVSNKNQNKKLCMNIYIYTFAFPQKKKCDFKLLGI